MIKRIGTIVLCVAYIVVVVQALNGKHDFGLFELMIAFYTGFMVNQSK